MVPGSAGSFWRAYRCLPTKTSLPVTFLTATDRNSGSPSEDPELRPGANSLCNVLHSGMLIPCHGWKSLKSAPRLGTPRGLLCDTLQKHTVKDHCLQLQSLFGARPFPFDSQSSQGRAGCEPRRVQVESPLHPPPQSTPAVSSTTQRAQLLEESGTFDDVIHVFATEVYPTEVNSRVQVRALASVSGSYWRPSRDGNPSPPP